MNESTVCVGPIEPKKLTKIFDEKIGQQNWIVCIEHLARYTRSNFVVQFCHQIVLVQWARHTRWIHSSNLFNMVFKGVLTSSKRRAPHDVLTSLSQTAPASRRTFAGRIQNLKPYGTRQDTSATRDKPTKPTYRAHLFDEARTPLRNFTFWIHHTDFFTLLWYRGSLVSYKIG